ncbi:MAG: hypothetical protein KC543_02815 [Myxococcales bacterium]|nr:hypothetical protein [Myxococcales bacterium]
MGPAAPNAPSPRRRPLWPLATFAVLVVVGIGWSRGVFEGGSQLASVAAYPVRTAEHTPSEEQLAAHVGYSGEFAVDGPSVLAVDVERDDTANRGGAEVSLVDSDEAVARVAVVRFSRGSPGRTVYLSAVPTGRYRLRLTGFEATDETVGAGADAAQGRGAGAGVIRAQVLTGKRSGVGLGIAVALLLLPIGVGLIRRRLRRSKGTATGQP